MLIGLPLSMLLLIFAAGAWAGAQNALAGGGSFVTLPVLILSGLDPRAANITSTVALFPAQVAIGFAGRKGAERTPTLGLRELVVISLVGGVLGAVLLLATPPSFFARLVPWLVLFATGVFAWGNFLRKPPAATDRPLGRIPSVLIQFGISIYGGYFGGGIGFLMLAGLTLMGMGVRPAAATKNVLAAVMNASAVAIFLFSPDLNLVRALALGAGAIAGGLFGSWALTRVNDRALKLGVVLLGVALTVGLFWRGV